MLKQEVDHTSLKDFLNNDMKGLMTAVLGLVIVGAINIYSSTFVQTSLAKSSILGNFFIKHLIFLIVSSLICSILFVRVDYHSLEKKKVLWALFAITILSLIAVFFFGTVINGARRWFTLGPISIQPSEFAKLTSVIWAAAYTAKSMREKGRSYIFKFKWFLPFHKGIGLGLLSFLIIIFQPDFGTGMTIFFFALIVVILGGASLKGISMITFIGSIIAFILVRQSPYRWARITTWYDPWSQQQDKGYQTVQSIISVGSGGIFGQQLGQGTSKYFFLPEAHTDFAFAVWAQEWGVVGVLLVIALVLLFIYYGFRISLKAKDYFGALLAAGMTLIIAGQAIFNMLMVYGIMPVTGVPLPFISYGGSAMLLDALCVTLLLNIAYYTQQADKARGRSGPLPSLREETQSRYVPSNKT